MIQTAGRGHYWRLDDGIWRYARSGDPVPGARDRRVWDAHEHYARRSFAGEPYVVVPAADLERFPYLAAALRRGGAVAEELDGVAVRYLVPERHWQPTEEPDPAGGMWAPELARDQLLGVADVAVFMGWLQGRTSVWPMVSRCKIPPPVLLLREPGRKGVRAYWTRPILEQGRARYYGRAPAKLRAGIDRYRARRWAQTDLAPFAPLLEARP